VPYTPSENFPDLIESMHDVDFFVPPAEAARALDALVDAGMRAERPPEGWLLKAWDGETLIDLIYSPAGGDVDDGFFERAETMEVAAQRLPVASLGDVIATKLLALNEQEPDMASVLEMARSLREQIDWDFVRARTGDAPFARAFFTLVEELGIVEPVA
jgi:hypothetical protein